MALIDDKVNPVDFIELDPAEAALPIWELIAASAQEIPLEARVGVPHDGARNYKHYLYGHEKENVPNT